MSKNHGSSFLHSITQFYEVSSIFVLQGGGSSSSSAGRSGGKAAEAKRYLLRLQHMCENQGRDTVSTGELHALATEIGLNVRDVSDFLEQLNEAGAVPDKYSRSQHSDA